MTVAKDKKASRSLFLPAILVVLGVLAYKMHETNVPTRPKINVVNSERVLKDKNEKSQYFYCLYKQGQIYSTSSLYPTEGIADKKARQEIRRKDLSKVRVVIYKQIDSSSPYECLQDKAINGVIRYGF